MLRFSKRYQYSWRGGQQSHDCIHLEDELSGDEIEAPACACRLPGCAFCEGSGAELDEERAAVVELSGVDPFIFFIF